MTNILKVINGDINLETGKFTPCDNPNCPIQTKFNGINSDTSTIDKYIEELVGHDQVEIFQKAFGQHLIKNQYMINIYGNSSSGKTTFIHLFRKLLGSNMNSVPSTLLTRSLSKFNNVNYSARIIVAEDFDKNDKILWGNIKMIASTDRFYSRDMYGPINSFVFGNLIAVTENQIPTFTYGCPKMEDMGAKRRLRPIEFINKFSNANKLSEMEIYLDQLLVWLVRGCVLNNIN